MPLISNWTIVSSGDLKCDDFETGTKFGGSINSVENVITKDGRLSILL